MLSKLKAIVPENLILLAKKTPKIPVGIVCANHKASIESAKEACDMDIINPIFHICIEYNYGTHKYKSIKYYFNYIS